jgi:hypothetical protein
MEVINNIDEIKIAIAGTNQISPTLQGADDYLPIKIY